MLKRKKVHFGLTTYIKGSKKKKNPKKSGPSRGVESEGLEPSSKQGIKRLSTKLSVYLIVGKQQA